MMLAAPATGHPHARHENPLISLRHPQRHNGAPSNANQALWTGDPTLGDNTPANQILRLPQLTLRKGNAYTTDATPSGVIRSIALKPALDPTGAGGRGLAQVLGELGDLALFITGDRKLTEVVLLDR